MNERDLKQLKRCSFDEENYAQIENFVDYEIYLKNSYFAHLVKHINLYYDFLKTGNLD